MRVSVGTLTAPGAKRGLMAHLELWRLATDVLLLGALVWLSYYIARGRSASAGPSHHHAHELERTLRGLIKEADLASSSLNDQLLRRQQSLERLLRDIEAAEARAGRAGGLGATTGARPSTTPAAPARAEMPRESVTPPEPPSFNSVGKAARPKPKRVETNIYGEPIGVAEAAPVEPAHPAPRVRSPLVESIEKEVVPAGAVPVVQAASVDAIAEVRRAAEDLLRAGRDLEFVAHTTRLPLEEVRLLSQLVVREMESRAAQAAPPTPSTPAIQVSASPSPGAPDVRTADPRLGVLSPIRRSIETI